MRKRIKRGGALLLALTLALTPVTLQAGGSAGADRKEPGRNGRRTVFC